MRKYLYLLALLFHPAQADEISFSEAINVTPFKQGTFHHLDASGRKSIASNNHSVAVSWEDNRDGKPQAYVAFKDFQQASFSKITRLSNARQEAYEPTLLAVNDTLFLFAWEQDKKVWLTTGNQQQMNTPALLDDTTSSQVSMAQQPNGKIFAAWIQHRAPHQQLVVSEITLEGNRIITSKPVIVDSKSSPRRQSFPSITATRHGIALGWEDREHGHTRIYTSFSSDGKLFTDKQVLNDFTPPQNTQFGRGTGATRVALASDKENMVVATWMDKRDFLGGYDIYAAISLDAGKHYGKDEIVQDMLGANQPQWHPTVAINQQGVIYVAWDDPRDDSPDVWLSYRLEHDWSDDQLVEPASGKGPQNNPSITFDANGKLHMVWIEQQGKATMLRYARQQ